MFADTVLLEERVSESQMAVKLLLIDDGRLFIMTCISFHWASNIILRTQFWVDWPRSGLVRTVAFFVDR